jgi:hypothetical protein
MKYWIIACVFLVGLSSCRKEGCTDRDANNFEIEAKKDDGSCTYEGCTDPAAVNYNPNALVDNGMCTYFGKVQFFTTVDTDGGDYVIVTFEDTLQFTLNANCPQSLITCDQPDGDNCGFIQVSDLEPGQYTYTAQSFTDGVANSIPESYVTITSGGCEIEVIGY